MDEYAYKVVFEDEKDAKALIPAIRLIVGYFKKAKENCKNPVAWALYQAWRKLDERK